MYVQHLSYIFVAEYVLAIASCCYSFGKCLSYKLAYLLKEGVLEHATVLFGVRNVVYIGHSSLLRYGDCFCINCWPKLDNKLCFSLLHHGIVHAAAAVVTVADSLMY